MPRPLVPERRNRILDAAERLVLERGFDEMSVHSVAEGAGISKGAVYREFEGKTEVLDALLSRSAARMNAEADRRMNGRPPASLSTAYRVGLEVLLADPLMTAAYLDDEGVLGSHVRAVTDGRYRERHRGIVAWISELGARGAIHPDVDPDALALALSSTTIGLLTAARVLGPLTREQLAAAIRAVEQLVAGVEATQTVP